MNSGILIIFFHLFSFLNAVLEKKGPPCRISVSDKNEISGQKYPILFFLFFFFYAKFLSLSILLNRALVEDYKRLKKNRARFQVDRIRGTRATQGPFHSYEKSILSVDFLTKNCFSQPLNALQNSHHKFSTGHLVVIQYKIV